MFHLFWTERCGTVVLQKLQANKFLALIQMMGLLEKYLNYKLENHCKMYKFSNNDRKKIKYKNSQI